MKLKESKIQGCYEILPNIFNDDRGKFVKTIYEPFFKENSLEIDYPEVFYSISKKNVLRGLHFQTPPKEQTKLIFCPDGAVIDVVVDLRKGSPTYGQFDIFSLTSELGNSIYIPSGLAHGFYVQSEYAIVVYNATNEFSPQHDSGIRWDSLSVPWPNKNPIISNKDLQLVSFIDFKSPF
jgi:dTDP-4-dehydrorhamnose 3,5-epimerase